jgi:hypothetical protein
VIVSQRWQFGNQVLKRRVLIANAKSALRLEYCAPPPGWGPQKLSRSLRRFRVPIPGLLTDFLLSNWDIPETSDCDAHGKPVAAGELNGTPTGATMRQLCLKPNPGQAHDCSISTSAFSRCS